MAFHYSQQEHEIMAAGFRDGMSDEQIAHCINNLRCNRERGIVRTVPSVHSKRRSLGLFRKDQHEESQPDHRSSDLLFHDAMRKAIDLGVERVKEGVFHDPTPFVGRMVHPEPVFSGCSSAAGICAEFGDQHAAEWEPA